jgi:hypothetical protein
MTSKYIVSCYSPPPQLKIENGQTVEVSGWKKKTENKVRAKCITNITKNGPTCDCGMPTKEIEKPTKALLLEEVTKKGKVSNVRFSADGVQFDLEY